MLHKLFKNIGDKKYRAVRQKRSLAITHTEIHTHTQSQRPIDIDCEMKSE